MKNFNQTIFGIKGAKVGKTKTPDIKVPSWQVQAKGGPADGELFRVPGPPFEDLTLYGVEYHAVEEMMADGRTPKTVSHKKVKHQSYIYVPREGE